MSRCVSCNRKIAGRGYFCADCLKQEVGNSPPSGLEGLWSLGVSLFHTIHIPSHWASDEEKVDWVATQADRITRRFPQIPPERAVSLICNSQRLKVGNIQSKAVARLTIIKASKSGREWAPLDIVLHPAWYAFALMTLMGLIYIASSI